MHFISNRNCYFENGEENIKNGMLGNVDYRDVECKLEVISEGEEQEQDPIGNSQDNEITVKEENIEPKQTTADERFVFHASINRNSNFSFLGYRCLFLCSYLTDLALNFFCNPKLNNTLV